MDVSCQCGTVSFTTPTAKPLGLFHCHCLQCQHQSGSAFGTSAIFPAASLFPLSPDLSSKLSIYVRPTKSGGTLDCYFCKNCGCRLMHRGRAKDGKEAETVSIKGGQVKNLDWTGGQHIWTQTAVVEIPRSAVRWEASPPPE